MGVWKYKLAIGTELTVDFGNEDEGIGSGSDQIAPLVGFAFVKGNTVLVPIVQHYVEYDGPDVNQTSVRLIAVQSLPNNFWGKLDAKLPFDWENNAVPASAEVQLGKMFNPSFGVYLDGLFGIGNDRPYEVGVGLGIRLTY